MRRCTRSVTSSTPRVWAEMLADRKFFNRVTSQPDPAAVTGGFGRRGPQPGWLPVGPDAFVEMDGGTRSWASAARQTIPVPALTARYATFPLAFTAGSDTSDGRFEVVGTGSGTFLVGVASLRPADNVSGFKATTIRWLKELGIEIARWPGGNFVSAYD